MAAAATPTPSPNGHDPSLEQSGEKLSIMDEVRQTLQRVRERSKTNRLNEDSRLFKFKQKLTAMGSEDDVERRRRFLAEHAADDAADDTSNGSGAGSGTGTVGTAQGA